MNKKKIHIKLITNGVVDEYNLLGTVEDNVIKYKESNKLQSSLSFDIKKCILIKDNIDYKIELKFKKNKMTTSKIYLKKDDKNLDLDVETIDLDISDNNIYVKYKILASSEIVEYSLKIGE